MEDFICSVCRRPGNYGILYHDREWPYAIEGKEVHRECYFNELGNVVEKNPIGFCIRHND